MAEAGNDLRTLCDWLGGKESRAWGCRAESSVLGSLLPRCMLLLRKAHSKANFLKGEKGENTHTHCQAFRMSVAAEDQKRRKGSRQQDQERKAQSERSRGRIWREKSCFRAMAYPESRASLDTTLPSGLKYTQIG